MSSLSTATRRVAAGIAIGAAAVLLPASAPGSAAMPGDQVRSSRSKDPCAETCP
ncbi:MAG TPA: hypothetical protein VNW50_03620 [Streptosporangiaceae bacterium]|nr:hypothetical protein [Streptosporangiaceae bacterium]